MKKEPHQTKLIPQLPKMYKAGERLRSFAFSMLLVMAITGLQKELDNTHFAILFGSYSFLMTLMFPAHWIIYLGENPEKFFTVDWKKKFLVFFGLWLWAIFCLIVCGFIRFDPLFLFFEIPALVISFLCLAIIRHYRMLFQKKLMLPKEE